MSTDYAAADKMISATMAKSWLDSDCLILDTETTGLNEWDEICEISIMGVRAHSLGKFTLAEIPSIRSRF